MPLRSSRPPRGQTCHSSWRSRQPVCLVCCCLARFWHSLRPGDCKPVSHHPCSGPQRDGVRTTQPRTDHSQLLLACLRRLPTSAARRQKQTHFAYHSEKPQINAPDLTKPHRMSDFQNPNEIDISPSGLCTQDQSLPGKRCLPQNATLADCSTAHENLAWSLFVSSGYVAMRWTVPQHSDDPRGIPRQWDIV